MKEVIALTFALAASTPLMAANLADRSGVYGGVDYTYQAGIGDNSEQSANGYGLTLGGSPIKWLDLELRNEFSTVNMGDGFSLDNFVRFNDYTATNNQLELAAIPYYGISNTWGVYGRAALGQNWADNLTDFTYGSVEPGVYFKPYGQKNAAQVNVGYRFRGSFDNNIQYNTNSAILGGEYAFNNRDSITGRYEYVTGDVEYNAFRVGYIARF